MILSKNHNINFPTVHAFKNESFPSFDIFSCGNIVSHDVKEPSMNKCYLKTSKNEKVVNLFISFRFLH